nr:hypothetical protein Iba_chr01aCG4730 [Ipomoea batatas]
MRWPPPASGSQFRYKSPNPSKHGITWPPHSDAFGSGPSISGGNVSMPPGLRLPVRISHAAVREDPKCRHPCFLFILSIQERPKRALVPLTLSPSTVMLQRSKMGRICSVESISIRR